MTIPEFVINAVRLACALCWLLLPVAAIAANLELVHLNACKDISDAFAKLRVAPSNCRNAAGAIEKNIRDGFAGSEVRLCFMESAPTDALSNFKCVRSSYRNVQSIACFRSAPLSLLSDFRANYVDKYSSPVSSYIEESKRCKGSNGDASRIIDSTFPSILTTIAEHDFGFNVQYGNTKPGSSSVSHGFAKSSPVVAQLGPQAIEYVVFAEGTMPELVARTSFGNWQLRIDTAPDFATPLLKALKRQNIDAYLASVDVGIERSAQALPLSKNPPLLSQLADVLVSTLDVEGFEEMSDEELKRHTGKSKREIKDAFLGGVAFGARKLINGRTPEFRVLMKTSGRSCTRNERGVIGAYILSFEGDRDAQADFGSILTAILGLGDCALTPNETREYLKNLVEESKEALLEDLKRR